MSTVEDILEKFGKKLVTDIRQSLRDNNVVFGGGQDSKLAAKTKFEIVASGNGIAFNLIMPNYWYWVNKGRDPGPVNKEGRASIAEWTKRKAIIGDFINKDIVARQAKQDESRAKLKIGSKRTFKKLKKLPFKKAVETLTFVVARSVAAKGYKGNKFADEVLQDGRLAKLQIDLKAAQKKDLIINFKIN